MSEYFETGKLDKIGNDLIQLLINNGYLIPQLKDAEYGNISNEVKRCLPTKESAEKRASETLKIEEDNIPCDSSKYLQTHLPIEQVLEQIARDYLGVCDDRKVFEKELKKVVKDYGHDQVILGFENWCSNQSGFPSNKPVSTFLKRAGQYVTIVSKPIVTNPLLDKTEKKIALITDNKVVFIGTYRIQLAAILKEHGEHLTVLAFEEFYKNVEDKQLPWAARDFLQRATVIVWTIKEKERQKYEQIKGLQQAYQQAASQVETVEEDEEL